MTTPALDSPVRDFFDCLGPFAGGEADIDAIARLLAGFARDTDYLAHHIERLGDRSGAVGIHVPDRGPRLLLVHRRNGEMGAIHSHKVWVAIAPISGVETHRRYDVAGDADDGPGRLHLTEERHLGPAETATLTPPDDVHAHGHVSGIGQAAYVLILTGDNQLRFEREQYDERSGACRTLAPGDAGDWLGS